ncbi:phage portal protein [Roseiconus lacunae]|uniref:Phage portal protein n=1 Tax=Roseiconus lacunae TaxID=2605694 RepID=A0ABT7PEP8_9BACT|nr:phage portal protein [Roseiconus lacunae]MDM4014965.1 phage portal protein [Roseiconus lacunae]
MRQPESIAKAFDDLRQDFRAAKQTRFSSKPRGVNPMGSGADWHYSRERDYLWMIERARAFQRDDMVVGQGVRRLVSNVVRGGFTPDPKTGDPDLDRAQIEMHEEWAADKDQCHSEGEYTFEQMERAVLRHAITDGDIWSLLRNDNKIQFAEAHRPRTPKTKRNVVHGVLLDSDSRREEVWIAKESQSPRERVSRVSDLKQYKIRDENGDRQVLQVYFPQRFSQRRGVTAFAPITDCVGMHDDLQFNTMVKAQMSSLMVIIREQTKDPNSGSAGPALGSSSANNRESENVGGDDAEWGLIPRIKAGLDVRLPYGEKAQGFTPNIPNPEFFPHTSLLLTFIAVNLDMPVQMLLLDPTKTNFSGWRGAIEQARIRFVEIQSDLVAQFHRPMWKWRVRNMMRQSPAIRKMAGRSGVNAFRHDWQFPGWPYIDKLKDAQADDLAITRFLDSPRRVQAARNRKWSQVAGEIVADKGILIRNAIEEADAINQQFPTAGVSWRELLGPGLTSESPVIQTIETGAGA